MTILENEDILEKITTLNITDVGILSPHLFYKWDDLKSLQSLCKRMEKSGKSIWEILERNEINIETAIGYLHERFQTPYTEFVLLNSYILYLAYLSGKPERCKELRNLKYADYLKTREWRIKRKLLILYYGKCQLCGKQNNVYHVHHNSYINKPLEKREDLIVLCPSCHESFHKQEESDNCIKQILVENMMSQYAELQNSALPLRRYKYRKAKPPR